MLYFSIFTKGVRRLLYFPTNVYPHNVAVDFTPSKPPTFTYTFNGDLLRWALGEYYDNDTGELTVSTYFPYGGNIRTYHNGDTVRVNMVRVMKHFENGKDYKYRRILFQSDPTDEDNNFDSHKGLYNIFLLESYLYADANSGATELSIDSNIKNIRSAYYYDGSDESNPRLIGGCCIEINHERHLISSATSDGRLILKDGFSFALKKGDKYRIYCNYVVSPFYFFKARKDPEIKKFSVTLNKNSPVSIDCNATYTQENDVTMKYHRWYLYNSNSKEKHGAGYVTDLAYAYNNASTDEEKAKISELQEKLDNYTVPITITSALTTSDLTGKYIRVFTTPIYDYEGNITNSDTAVSCTAKITSYAEEDGYVTLSYNNGLSFIPVSTSTQSTENPSETNLSFEILSYTEKLIADSGAIYSYDMPYSFYEYPFEETKSETHSDLRVMLEVCTQDGKIVYNDKFVNFNSEQGKSDLYIKPPVDSSIPMIEIDNSKRSIKLEWSTSNPSASGLICAIYRKRVDRLETNTPLVYCGYLRKFEDYLVGSNRTYRYYIIPIETDTKTGERKVGQIYETPDITPKWCGWSLTSITPATGNSNTTYNKHRYQRTGDTWVLAFENQSGTITQNETRSTSLGIASYPKVSVSDNGYISGSFSAMLGNFNTKIQKFDDDLLKVESWREFISQDTPYLLKTSKGDVWVVSVSDAPKMEYDESLRGCPATVSFDFIECDNINNVYLT